MTFLSDIDPVSATFQVNPTTVYGVLALLLLLGLLAVSRLYINAQAEKDSLLRETLNALNGLDKSFSGIDTSLAGLSKETLRELQGVREHVKAAQVAVLDEIRRITPPK